MRLSAGALALLFSACWLLPGQSSSSKRSPAVPKAGPAVADPKAASLHVGPSPPVLPTKEKLIYDVEWRLIHAGSVIVDSDKARASMKLESAGLVSSLFKVNDTYSVDYDDQFCASGTRMDSQEGKRYRETKVTFDRSRNRASYLERDVIKDVVLHTNEVDVPNCVHDVLGAILRLRRMTVEPTQSTQVPMSDGRRTALVKIEAQGREEIKTPAGAFPSIRYEAYMLNSVIYQRKGQVFVWLSDDVHHLPVQIRLRMQFPIGTVTLQLQKEEHS